VSSHLEINRDRQADLYASKLASAVYPHKKFDEGDTISLSDRVELAAINTPGHSPDSISVILREDGKDKAVFTGDALLFGSVGRPDLREYSGEAATLRKELAQQMYQTIHQKYAGLDDAVLVYPAHGAGSLCGKGIRDVKQSTIGYEKENNFAFENVSEDEFVKVLLADQPHVPKYFPYDVELNKKGAASLEKALNGVPILSPEGAGSAKESLVIDSRTSDRYRASHLPRSVNIPEGEKFATWLGTIVGSEEEFYLVVGNHSDIRKQLLYVAKIGYEPLLKGVVVYGDHPGDKQEEFDKTEFDAGKEDFVILDVRSAREAEDEKIFDKAVNIPLPELEGRLGEIPVNKPVYVHCASGYRSSIASSLIRKAHPDAHVYDVSGKIKDYR